MGWSTLFQVVTIISMSAWAILIVLPRSWRIQLAPSLVVPMGLCFLYMVIIISSASYLIGNFSSLESFTNLFRYEAIVVSGWIQTQILNLFVGGWIAQKSDEIGISRLAQAPILLLTLIFGPIGYIVFKLIEIRQPKEIYV